jgi:hypothetical protein
VGIGSHGSGVRKNNLIYQVVSIYNCLKDVKVKHKKYLQVSDESSSNKAMGQTRIVRVMELVCSEREGHDGGLSVV